jgi:flagellar FliL protein
MAEENTETEEVKSGGMKKMIIIAVLGLVLVGAGAGGALVLFGGDEEEMIADEKIQDEEMMDEDVKKMKDTPAIYLDLHPAFVANFTGDSKKKYMQVYMVALAKEQETIDKLEMHMPAVRNNILMALSRKTSEDVETVEGKEQLRKEVLEVVRETMIEKVGKAEIEDLYFTKFVAQ